MALWSLPETLRAAVVAFTVATSVAGVAGVAGVAAQESSPAAVECAAPELPPGTPTPQEEQEEQGPPPAASPEAEAEHDMDDMAAGSEEPVDEGEEADDEVYDAAVAGVENFVACINAGDAEGTAALLTDNFLLTQFGIENPYDFVASFPVIPLTLESARDVRVHADGRVSVDVVFQGLYAPNMLGHERWYLVEEDGYYKIDELTYALYEDADVFVDVNLVDYGFELSQTTFAAGETIAFTLNNVGTEPHEMVVVRLPEGATVEDVLSGAVPEDQIVFFGFGFAEPGQSGYLALTGLEPGTYTLVCFIPSPDGTPHVVQGMASEFTVE